MEIRVTRLSSEQNGLAYFYIAMRFWNWISEQFQSVLFFNGFE